MAAAADLESAAVKSVGGSSPYPGTNFMKYTSKSLREAVATSTNFLGVTKKLNTKSYTYVKLLIRKLGIDTSHFRSQKASRQKARELKSGMSKQFQDDFTALLKKYDITYSTGRSIIDNPKKY